MYKAFITCAYVSTYVHMYLTCVHVYCTYMCACVQVYATQTATLPLCVCRGDRRNTPLQPQSHATPPSQVNPDPPPSPLILPLYPISLSLSLNRQEGRGTGRGRRSLESSGRPSLEQHATPQNTRKNPFCCPLILQTNGPNIADQRAGAVGRRPVTPDSTES
jgi:hypothetical protein